MIPRIRGSLLLALVALALVSLAVSCKKKHRRLELKTTVEQGIRKVTLTIKTEPGVKIESGDFTIRANSRGVATLVIPEAKILCRREEVILMASLGEDATGVDYVEVKCQGFKLDVSGEKMPGHVAVVQPRYMDELKLYVDRACRTKLRIKSYPNAEVITQYGAAEAEARTNLGAAGEKVLGVDLCRPLWDLTLGEIYSNSFIHFAVVKLSVSAGGEKQDIQLPLDGRVLFKVLMRGIVHGPIPTPPGARKATGKEPASTAVILWFHRKLEGGYLSFDFVGDRKLPLASVKLVVLAVQHQELYSRPCRFKHPRTGRPLPLKMFYKYTTFQAYQRETGRLVAKKRMKGLVGCPPREPLPMDALFEVKSDRRSHYLSWVKGLLQKR